MFVPWSSISGNIAFMHGEDKEIETADGIACAVKKYTEIHILSQEATELVSELYDMQVMSFLRLWYKKCPWLSEMWFVYLELKKNE